jgi:hypothetical protein
MWIIHDGVDPGHGPLAHSVDLVEQARANGWTPRFDRVLAPSFVRTTVWEQQLAWLAQQVKKTSGHPAPPVANASVGPVCRAFAERFVVVEATGGSDTDREACRRTSLSFQDAWRRTQFGDCRVMSDVALTAEEARDSNLVLIGNADTNKAWGRLAAKLPAHLKADSIDIAGHTFQGKDLAIQGVVVHPDYPDRRIVFIGSANLETAVFGTQELAIDGWFDYAIWQNVGGKAELIAAERYAP